VVGFQTLEADCHAEIPGGTFVAGTQNGGTGRVDAAGCHKPI
jgi:hypothetical protein